MTEDLFNNKEFYSNTLNSIPFPTMVVDEDVRILSWNTAASRLLSGEEIFRQRGGDVLYCIHSKEAIEGCGYSNFCKTCIIRNSVNKSISGGKVYREKTVMELTMGGKVREVPLLVTTSPLNHNQKSLAVLILEDIDELIQISNLLPICAKCKKIRTDKNQWLSVEKYIKEYIVDVDFTHGICPDCMKEYLPNNKT